MKHFTLRLQAGTYSAIDIPAYQQMNRRDYIQQTVVQKSVLLSEDNLLAAVKVTRVSVIDIVITIY